MSGGNGNSIGGPTGPTLGGGSVGGGGGGAVVTCAGTW
jgi:hypothetical protein